VLMHASRTCSRSPTKCRDERQGTDRAAKAKRTSLRHHRPGYDPAHRHRIFAGIAAVKLVHIPYKGANETTTAILSGRST